MNNLNKKIIKLFVRKKIKISVAESCTGGLLSSSLTLVPNSSKAFSLGLITYSNESKINILNVPKKLLLKYGSVSKEVCISMVKNLSKLSKTYVSISITGIAGPGGGTFKKPVGLVYVGIKIGNRIICKKLLLKNKSRNYIQKETVKKTLKFIINFL